MEQDSLLSDTKSWPMSQGRPDPRKLLQRRRVSLEEVVVLLQWVPTYSVRDLYVIDSIFERLYGEVYLGKSGYTLGEIRALEGAFHHAIRSS